MERLGSYEKTSKRRSSCSPTSWDGPASARSHRCSLGSVQRALVGDGTLARGVAGGRVGLLGHSPQWYRVDD